MLKLLKFNQNKIDIFKDPFTKESVDHVSIFVYPDRTLLDVYFRNGSTQGVQEIKTTTLMTALEQAQAFIDSLPD